MKYAYDFFEFNVDSYILYLENLEDTTRSVENIQTCRVMRVKQI
jgi:hypothetical protein